ncbi:MAG TPA: hypothetical protein VNN22_20395 [Verrucomicrobiae bacterium]|nr:hypothetical protein [Verrucomicrobiae bacterium]
MKAKTMSSGFGSVITASMTRSLLAGDKPGDVTRDSEGVRSQLNVPPLLLMRIHPTTSANKSTRQEFAFGAISNL